MNNSSVAHIRTPNDDELRHVGELWAALKQKNPPASTDIGIGLQIYLRYAVRNGRAYCWSAPSYRRTRHCRAVSIAPSRFIAEFPGQTNQPSERRLI